MSNVKGWLLFVVSHAYYSGAMTMFFSTKEPPPFESAAEALDLHPRWKMVMSEGEIALIFDKVYGKNPDWRFQEWYRVGGTLFCYSGMATK